MKLHRKFLAMPTAVAALLTGAVVFAQESSPQTDVKSPPAPEAQATRVLDDKSTPETLLVPSGTQLPLVLHNAITTRNAQPGDPLYLETVFPVVLNSRVLIPAGSYVQGEIIEAKRPGRVKGRGEVRVRLTTLILPNGYTVRFDA